MGGTERDVSQRRRSLLHYPQDILVLSGLCKASELLRDTSLGANLRIHLVRTIILTEPEVAMVISLMWGDGHGGVAFYRLSDACIPDFSRRSRSRTTSLPP